MKIFLSWSGHKSHEVAKVFRSWIPSVLQSVTPYVSSEDIDKGARWSSDIAKELADSAFGILCVTKDNIDHPWLLFEAGALSKTIDKSSVCPFLFDLKMAEIKEGPILQFQATEYRKDDIKKLMSSLNKCCGDTKLNDELFEKTFEIWWPKLEQDFDSILKDDQGEKPASKKVDNSAILEELLTLTRINQKLLRSPEELLPEDYLRSILLDKGGNRISSDSFEKIMLNREMMELCDNISMYIENHRHELIMLDDSFIKDTTRLIELLRRRFSMSISGRRRLM